MEAYLDLQKQIYLIVAIAKTGGVETARLNNSEKERFEIDVKVTSGSSKISTDLGEPLKELAKYMIDKLTGQEVVILLLGSAIIYCAKSAFSAFLENRKEILAQECESKEKTEMLNALNFANAQQLSLFNKVLEMLSKQGLIGKQIADGAQHNNEIFLKAATRVAQSNINGQELSREEASLLRSTITLPMTQKIITQEMIVYYMNTGKPDEITVGLCEAHGTTKYKVFFKDDLFNHADNTHLMTSLRNRTPIWVKLLIRETEDDVKAIQLLGVTDPPPGIISSPIVNQNRH